MHVLSLEHVRAEVVRHTPLDAVEREHVARTLALLRDTPRPLQRDNLPGHLTASAFVWDADARCVLLIRHAKLGRWLQPGGHCEPAVDPTLIAAAWRELAEETGLGPAQVRVASPAPFDVDVHPIPARGIELDHEHHDVRYLFELAEPPPAAIARAAAAGSEARWAPVRELAESEDASLRRVGEKLRAR